MNISTARRGRRAGRRPPCGPTGQMRPGAVPSCWGMGVAPTGTSAWRPLLSGMSRPRELNISAMRCDDLGVTHERHVHDLGDGVTGDVVVGGPEPAAHHHPVAAGQGACAGPARCAPGCPPPPDGNGSRCRPGPAARPATPSWCRRSGPSSSSVPTARTSILTGRGVAAARAARAGRRAGTAPR